MATKKLEKIREYTKTLSQFESEVGATVQKLRELPTRMGFDSMDELIEALQLTRAPGALARPVDSQTQKRVRAVITPSIRGKVDKLWRSGKTAAEIAKTLRVSVPTVFNIRKRLGLVRDRARRI